MHFQNVSVAVVLPITPRIAFTASESDIAFQALAQGDHTTIVRQINQQIVSQARQYVWGVDDRPLSFVQKYICTIPDRQIISREAMELSLKQARGNA
jgi:hypothetical protein